MNDILEEIDKLKMMVIMERALPHKNAVEEFQEWVEELQGRKKPFDYLNWPIIVDGRKYAEYKTLLALVEDLYHQKHAGDKEYQKNRSEFKRMLAEVIAMAMFVQEKK